MEIKRHGDFATTETMHRWGSVLAARIREREVDNDDDAVDRA
jgi:hypothetical protein